MSFSNLARRVLDRLSRVTSSGNFVPEIDGLRFVAVVSVFVFHVQGHLLASNRFPNSAMTAADVVRYHLRGQFGVYLFFAISGFILALPFAAQRLASAPAVNLRRYYLRRLTRLEPPYFLNLVLVFLVFAALGRLNAAQQWPHLLASLGYVHNGIYRCASSINPVAWSLEVEVQFYLLAPLLCLVYSLRSPTWRRALMVLAALPAWWFQCHTAHLSLLSFLHYFMSGFLLADIYLTGWKRAPVRRWWWDCLSLGAWAAMVGVAWSEFVRTAVLPLLIVIAYMGAFRGPLFNRLFRNRWLVTIGGMCYTIYLYHPFLISLWRRFTFNLTVGDALLPNLLLQILLVGVPTLACCAVLFLILEKPFMRPGWPDRCLAAWRSLHVRRTCRPETP